MPAVDEETAEFLTESKKLEEEGLKRGRKRELPFYGSQPGDRKPIGKTNDDKKA